MSEAPAIDHVTWIYDDRIEVICESPAGTASFRGLGGTFHQFSGARGFLSYVDEGELARRLAALRDEGFAMAGADSGWPPSAVFEHLRETGKLTGKYIEVVWRSPSEREVRTK
jgi:hypothetical protein